MVVAHLRQRAQPIGKISATTLKAVLDADHGRRWVG